MNFVGIDIGSTMTKVVIVDSDEKIIACFFGQTGAEHRRLANVVTNQALEQAELSLSDIDCIVSTGYGRVNVHFADYQFTEIKCHAKGICKLFPQARTIIDIGGQDSKGIRVKDGKVLDFVMNDKCAAGTGRFLEIIADIMGVKVSELADLALKAEQKTTSSNICSVYAAQEVMANMAKGMKREDIAAGLHQSMAIRICNMVKRIGIKDEVVMTGGGAKNKALRNEVENYLGIQIQCPEEPLITGALGAALLGKEMAFEELQAGRELPKREMRLGEVRLYD
ncbi:MAG: 2-hydroxyglutaryl-CoA dehydratase [Deltaproteobacteria bacterium]|nr:2-hydroxyglutaryl-CoA dehydratase [Deltaproteobacteria bacterium]